MAGNSSITGDQTITFTDNMSFDGTDRGGAMSADGQLWIGSATSNRANNGGHVRLGTLTAGTGVNITNGAGSITLAVDGSAVGQTITGDSGGALSPSAGNWNILGSGSITTTGSGSTLTAELTGLTNHALLVGAGTTTITKVGPSATTGQVLQSQGSLSDPTFSTATYPATTTINQILYSSAANTVTGLATANNGTLITSATGVPSLLANGTTGQVLTATTGSPPSWAAAPASSNLVYINSLTASNSATISFTSIGSYTTYLLLIKRATMQASGDQMYLRISTDNGSTYKSTNYTGSCYLNSVGTTTFFSTGNNTGQACLFMSVSNSTSQTVNGEFYLHNINSGDYPCIVGNGAGYDTGNLLYGRMSSFSMNTGFTGVNAFQIAPSTTGAGHSIATGVFTLFGIRESA